MMSTLMNEQFIAMQLFSHIESDNEIVRATCGECIAIIS